MKIFTRRTIVEQDSYRIYAFMLGDLFRTGKRKL